MADQEMLAAIATGELIIQVNAERSFYDPFRLNPSLDDLISTREGTAKVANSAALMGAGDQVGAQDRVVQSREKLAELLRHGFAYLKGLPALDVPVAGGVSVGVTVSIGDFSPPVPGVAYQVWVTGHNSRGDGPAGNKITFTA